MSEAAIRAAQVGDVPALHEALVALSRHLGDEDAFRCRPEHLLTHGFGDRPMFRALIAEADGALCGATVYFPEFSTLRGSPGVYVQDLFVAEERRGGGLGRKLLRAVMREARGWEATYLKLATHAKNPAAIRFYERLGFTTDREEMTFVIEGDAFLGLDPEA